MEIDERIESLYSTLISKIYDVYDIFKEYYGEYKVDLQDVWSKERWCSYLLSVGVGTYINKPRRFSLTRWEEIRNTPIVDITDDEDKQYLIDNIAAYVKKDIIPCGFILVWWPSVRVTNEHDRYVDITHLYAKVSIEIGGSISGRFTLNRAEYPMEHLRGGYMHSHVSYIPFSNFTYFQSCCTGSGPINDTICSLSRGFDAELWQLFCLELDKYVHVESIAGTPYHRLEDLGVDHMSDGDSSFTVVSDFPYFVSAYDMHLNFNDFLTDFIKSKQLKFNFSNGCFSIGMSYVDYIMTISNAFINWYNKAYNDGKVTYTVRDLTSKIILRKCIVSNGKIFYPDNTRSSTDYTQYEGKKVCTFKGKEIKVRIIDAVKEDSKRNESLILNTEIALHFLYRILKVLNYKYGRTEETTSDQSGTKTFFF